MIGGHNLVVVREIVSRRGIVGPADIFRQPVERFGRHVPRRFEHDMFEQMRETGTTLEMEAMAALAADVPAFAVLLSYSCLL